MPELRPVAIPPIAFTVAVTGHRTLAPGLIARIEEQVSAQLRAVGAVLQARGQACELDEERPIELRFLSALAAGTDQIAARAALGDAGWQLHAALPFADAAYRQTMLLDDGAADEGARAEFDRLLALASRRLVIADWSAVEPSELADHWRNRRFRTLGQLLVRQAELIVAVWRGGPAGGSGGTAEVVAEALRVGTPVIWIDAETGEAYGLSQLEIGENPVALAARVRESGSHPPAEAIDAAIQAVLVPATITHGAEPSRASLVALVGHPSAGAAEPVLARTWAGFYQQCVWALLWFARTEDGKRRLATWPGFRLATNHAHAALSRTRFGDWRDPLDATLAPAIGAADAIATRLGHLYRSSYAAIFLLAGLAVGIGLAGSFFHHDKPWFVAVELATLLVVLVLYRMARRWCWHQRWLNGRHLAESLRGIRLLSWVGFGGRRPVSAQAPWSAWLSNSFAALPGIPDGTIAALEIGRIARDAAEVVVEQGAYHGMNHQRLERLHKRLDHLGWACVGLAALVALGFVGWAVVDPHHLPEWSLALVTLAGGWLPAMAAALAGIRFQGDFERFAKRSHETQAALDRLQGRLEAIAARAERGGGSEPLYEELLAVLLAVQDAFEKDLEDWRFVYAERPTPGL